MARLRRQEWSWLLIGGPIWLAWMGFASHALLTDGLYPEPFIAESAGSPDDHPRVRLYADAAGTAVPLGARLLRAGDVDLRGADTLRTRWALTDQGRDGRLAVAFEADGRVGEAILELPRVRGAGALLLMSASFVGTALLLLVRVPHSRAVRAFLPAMLTWTLSRLWVPAETPAVLALFSALRIAVGCLWGPLVVLAALAFPDDARPPHAPLPRWPWIFAVLGLTWTSFTQGWPWSPAVGVVANSAVGAAIIVAALGALAWNWRRAGPAGRRQMKWVMLGFYVGATPLLVGSLLRALRPELSLHYDRWAALVTSSMLVTPLFLWIGVRRANLLDIDRVLGATTAWSLLLGAGLAAVLSLAPRAAKAAASHASLDPGLVQTAFSMSVALLVVGPGQRVRRRLEARFFRERQALEAGVDALARELGAQPDTPALLRHLGERLDALLEPDGCAVFARGADGYDPVFASGTGPTPGFELQSRLLARLAAKARALDLDRGPHALAALEPSPDERGALEDLGAAVLVPVPADGALAALVVLGRKGSGDVYTSAELALLSALAASAGHALARFGEADLRRAAQAQEERLRRWVPSAVAEQLARGRELAAGERDVTMLFVDVRGYTGLADGRAAGEVFSAIDRYTATASGVVSAHGGTLVQFAGDGLMAVFGAPEPLPDKEARALAAAREIPLRVAQLAVELVGPAGLRVGVGVATGSAYVGPIRSADRQIWTVIGSTTNLAARLQQLTRELGVEILVDEATWRRAGRPAPIRALPATPIRGLREPRDLFGFEPAASTAT
jgi:class 3 adenylate cyclase